MPRNREPGWPNATQLVIQIKRTFLKDQENKFKELYNSLSKQKKLIFRYILNSKRKQKHDLHMVAPSPWPIYSAICAFLFVLGMILWMHHYTIFPLICGILALISAFVFWFRDIIREGLYMGSHSDVVSSCLRLGFVLFLISEVMFFFGFFWTLLHFTLTPSIVGGGIWPPQGIVLYILSEDVFYPYNSKVALLKSLNPLTISEYHSVDNFFFW
jgi:hypothetical protein